MGAGADGGVHSVGLPSIFRGESVMQEKPSNRHEFRFIIDDIELSAEQREQIARQVQEAGMRALTSIGMQVHTVAVDIGSIGDRLQWRGKYLLAGELAHEFAAKVTQQFNLGG